MCLISIAWRAHPRYELVLAANRDEYHNRAAAPAAPWTDAPEVWGGRDRVQGGGWLALSQRGRLAAVTNVRRMVPPDPLAPSRGALVSDFVRGHDSAPQYAARLQPQATRYAGYNLLLWDGHEVLYVSNQPQFTVQPLAPGVHAVSNAALDTPWPKLLRLRHGLETWLQENPDRPEALFTPLADEHEADEAELPDTGVGVEMERFLSPPFIRGLHYGTRASSVITVARSGATQFLERRYGPGGAAAGDSKGTLQIALPQR